MYTGAQFKSELFNNLAKLLGSSRIRCTAYHPQANGMVERFHRQLKTALISHSSPNQWTEFLPLVMLGIQTSVKTDAQCSSEELVFGTTLKLLGGFINPNTNSQKLNLENYVDQLQDRMSKLKPLNTREKSSTIYVPKDLSNCTQVWIRCDKVKAPLSPPFECPFKVVPRKSKYFMIEKYGNTDSVSIDRLKPTYLDHELPYVWLDRLTDETITESTCKNNKSLQVTKTVRWAHPISQSRILTVLAAE
ncbi:unnamed protein product [Schistosoma mattheei]|uniref:Uncharacterized protein n=1 Tax=Schistosoma mattheei TaxID=31246 RepID=A0A183NNY4_9TREM|nr:unnamed protein product [Schistosoma mattheei]